MNKYEQQRANIEAARKKKQEAELAKKKQQTKYIIISVIVLVAILFGIVATVLITNYVKNKDVRLLDKLPNTVKMNVTYEDNEGTEHTGDIIIELYPDEAPITVRNFKKLVSESFYDGIIFHRVIENFMIQSGDPQGTGYGGSEETIKGEFSQNGVENNIKHVRGTISMARQSGDMNSASSQFFIVHQTSASNTSSLDGGYAAFGMVLSGMDIVDAIATMDTDANDKPLNDAHINTITFVED